MMGGDPRDPLSEELVVDRPDAAPEGPQMTAPDGPADHGTTGPFDSLNSALEEAPMTWIPALLKTLVYRAVDEKVFVTGQKRARGIIAYVRGILSVRS
ncbi:MAG: hypothetical protein V3R16_09640 [Nitrospirales bacterium]